MSKYWSNTVKGLEPYVPGEQPRDRQYIKLNTNENPYPPSPGVIDAIRHALDERLRLYPDPVCKSFKEAAAQYFNIEQDMVFAGNGSDEVLAFSFKAFYNEGDQILIPEITYTFYPVYCGLYGINYKTVKLARDFSFKAEDFFRDGKGVVLPNPNAPTGKIISVGEVKKIVEYDMERVVIIDEAYIDFGGVSCVPLIKEYPNLLVVQTMSKSRSLAGMRIGYALGQKHLIEALDRIKNSFNSYTMDTLALSAALRAFADDEYYKEINGRVEKTREKTSEELKELGFEVVDSKANFLFIKHETVKAVDIFTGLRKEGILVRYFNRPLIDNYLRVSIGTGEEMVKFLNAVRKIV